MAGSFELQFWVLANVELSILKHVKSALKNVHVPEVLLKKSGKNYFPTNSKWDCLVKKIFAHKHDKTYFVIFESLEFLLKMVLMQLFRDGSFRLLYALFVAFLAALASCQFVIVCYDHYINSQC